jgi:hypothetical protein
MKTFTTRALVGGLAALLFAVLVAGCAPKVDREAPTGSAPPNGQKGAIQPGTMNKAPVTE